MGRWDDKLKSIRIGQLLPNILTLTALCAGLSAIRFGVQGNYVLAVQMILAACVLDGLDGRVARRMGGESAMGAELDSLADFLNFGVAPSLVLYFWALEDMRSAAWLAVLIFAMCSVIRLARFNVGQKDDEDDDGDGSYFIGVPAPGAALLVLLPMFLSFAYEDLPVLPDVVICFYMMAIGLMMICRFHTISFKAMKIAPKNVALVLLGAVIFIAAALTFAWETLVALCVAYGAVLFWGTVVRGIFLKGKK
jgi:CDP-diacylglycerol--serine O-phosphatidyltransferase